VALAPEHGIDTRTLLSRADLALFAAKAAGRSTVRVFEPVLEAQIRDRVALETELRAALADPVGLFVFYQPTVDIASGRVTAREALLRWHHPARGWIPPSEFIPVAEQSSLIDRLGRFVLDHACEEAMTWDDDARVSVNVSAAQLGNETLSPSVRAALAKSGLPADRLELEVTETALLRNRREAISDLQRIHDLGVRVALDDFGTGYSSLAHLRAFPFDKIKIDGTFVRDAVTRADCAAVVRAIVELGDRLGVAVVAECVETQAQLAQVSREGCREVQGYLLGRPAPGGNDAIAVDALNTGRSSRWAEHRTA
jgi:predicted signal transduction protein with EAL and GGDEF domain